MHDEHRGAAYDDDDFELAADDVTVSAMALNRPELLTAVRAWVTKLTSGHRGHNEISYLRTLRRMVVHRRVCWPFVDPPPAGPLPPLSRYLNPPGAPCHETTRSDRCLVKRFQRETFTRASQTVGGYEVDEVEDATKEQHDDSIDGLADLDVGNGAAVVGNETDADNGVDEKPNDGAGGTEGDDDKDGDDVDVTYNGDKIGKHDGEGGEDDDMIGIDDGKDGDDDGEGGEDDVKGREDDGKGVEDDEKGGEDNKAEENQRERIEDDKAKRDEVDKVGHED